MTRSGLLDFLRRNNAFNFGVIIRQLPLFENKTMKKLLNFILLFNFFSLGFAEAQQTPEKKEPVRILGVAKDLKTGQPVGYATAALYKAGSDVSTSGAVADGNGVFYITGFTTGTYELQLSFLGYETVKRTVNVNSLEDAIDLGEIGMSDEGVALEEVTVQGQRELIEERVDRTIYKALLIGGMKSFLIIMRQQRLLKVW